MDHGLFTITLIEKDQRKAHDEPAQIISKAELHQKISCCQFGGITKVLCNLSSFQTTERTTQMFTANMKFEKRPELANRKRNRIPSRQCEASHIFSNMYETIGVWLERDVPPPT